MDIPKRDSYRKTVFTVLLVLVSGLNTFGKDQESIQILIDSYELTGKLTTETPPPLISELNEALALCTDDTLKFRIEYRIGMISFKAGDLVKAVSCFEKIAQTVACPDLIKLCSLNMVSQIYRIQAKDGKALKTFGELIELSKKSLTEEPILENPASVLKLVIIAGFGRAEIYQYNRDYDSAIIEYKRILIYLKSNKTINLNSYAPLALDRISQLHLIKGRIEDYEQVVIELTEKYPNYYRTGIIRLEARAVKILGGKDGSVSFSRGSFDTPARLIALIKDTGDKELKDETVHLLKNLRSKYNQSYGGILLSYHYAWLLDAIGDRKQAAEMLEDICKQTITINTDIPGAASVISTLSDYAKLQYAIILCEKNKYKEAIEIICSLKPHPNDVHIVNLSDSIENALQTLKRDVPKNANDR